MTEDPQVFFNYILMTVVAVFGGIALIVYYARKTKDTEAEKEEISIKLIFGILSGLMCLGGIVGLLDYLKIIKL